MTKEQEEAIKTMKHWIDYEKNNRDKINKADELINMQETVLSMLKEISADSAEKDKIIAEKSAEIEKLKTDFKIVDQECSRLERKEAKQDKMIDLMAEELQTHMFVVSVGKTIIGKKGIKEYYEQKATNDV